MKTRTFCDSPKDGRQHLLPPRKAEGSHFFDLGMDHSFSGSKRAKGLRVGDKLDCRVRRKEPQIDIDVAK